MRKPNTLDKIDDYFASQPQNYLPLALLMIFGAIGYVIYDYSFEESEKYLQEQTSGKAKAEQTLNNLEKYIRDSQNSRVIKTLQARLAEAQKNQKLVEEDIVYYDQKLREVSKIIYNQENWSKFISKVNKFADDYRLKINQVRSRRNSALRQEVQEAFDVEFDLVGKYQSILLFINALEKAVEVVDVKSIKMTRLASVAQRAQNNMPAEPALDKNQADGAKKDYESGEVVVHMSISVWGLLY